MNRDALRDEIARALYLAGPDNEMGEIENRGCCPDCEHADESYVDAVLSVLARYGLEI